MNSRRNEQPAEKKRAFGRIGTLAVIVTTFLFVACWAMARMAAYGDRPVAPADGMFRHAKDRIDRQLSVVFTNNDFLPAMDLPGRSTAVLDLPRMEDGCEITILGQLIMSHASNTQFHVAEIDVSVAGKSLGNFSAKRAKVWNRQSIHGARFEIPASNLQEDINRVTFTIKSPETFRCRMVISQNRWCSVLENYALPLSAVLLLAVFAWFATGTHEGRLFGPLLLITLFATYSMTLSSMKLAPMADYFFGDPGDYVRPVCLGEATADTARHPLFLPLAHVGFKLVHTLAGGSGADAMATLFAIVGALNGFAAWLVFRIWFDRPRTAALAAILYSFSFAVWVFSSHYETYIFATLATNVFLLAMLSRDFLSRSAGRLFQTLSASAAALINPPLLVLTSIPLVRHWIRGGRKGIASELGLAASVLAVYVSGSHVITGLTSRSKSRHEPQVFEAQTDVFHRYAQKSNRTVHAAANVAAGQFAYSFTGQPFASNWSDGLAGLERILRTRAPGYLAATALGALWLGGLAGLLRNRSTLAPTLLLAVMTLLPYLAFFWFFNPNEMLLYSAPLVLPLLAWLLRGWQKIVTGPTAFDVFLLLIAGAFALHNTLCLASYP